MKTKCLLVCDNGIIVAGVKSLLAKEAGLEFYVIRKATEAELAQHIARLQPDVVLVDKDTCKFPRIQLRNLLMRLPTLRVIIFSQKNNVLHIYQSEWSEIDHALNLEKAIHCHSYISVFAGQEKHKPNHRQITIK